MDIAQLAAAYIPMDRRQAMARGLAMPEHAEGVGLFADISGFTPLAEALVHELGEQRGAEELTGYLNLVYDALIARLHRYGGSVIGFSGDAITCWFDIAGCGLPECDMAGAVRRAVRCGLEMQDAMKAFAAVPAPSGHTVTLAMKAAIAAGHVRRFLVGDPKIQVVDTAAGSVLDWLACGEHLAQRGEVLVDGPAAGCLNGELKAAGRRRDETIGRDFLLVTALDPAPAPAPWPALPPQALGPEQVRPWLIPAVYDRLSAGGGEFLAELRPAVALFVRFCGIDYEGDPAAGVVLDAYIRRVQGILARYAGTLIQLTIGDKGSYLYAAFGAPAAHEDDAARAASAALDLLELDACGTGPVQMGLAAGRMRTGAYGSGDCRTYGVLGSEVNLAARLMQAATAGQVLASAAVHAAAGETFRWEYLPPIRVKGRESPIDVFDLQGRFERRSVRLQGPAYALPMVGREAELALIAGKLDQALAGRGQIVGITGPAGSGKSRLLAEVIRLAAAHGLEGYGGECQSYGVNTSYLVWQSIWWSFFGLDAAGLAGAKAGPESEALAADLARRLDALAPGLGARAPLLGAVLNVAIPDNDLTAAFDAKLRKSSLEALLVDCVRARSRRGPLLFVLEDCHWLDPLSHDLLDAIGRAAQGMPVLIVLCYRPPGAERLDAPRVGLFPYFCEVTLADFTQAETEQLIDLKLAQFGTAQASLPRALVERIAGLAEGNPFYVEELLNYLRARGIDPYDAQATVRVELPTSLQSLILSRIDQLNEDRRTALKVASVIGRMFAAAALWGVCPELGAPEHVKDDLVALARLELIAPQTAEPELAYLFKHALSQEVAYESLPFATRAGLHEQVGAYIERTRAGNLDQHLDLLAYHYDRSPNLAKKRKYLLAAGTAAQAAYSNFAAIDYFQRVVPLLPPGEQGPVLLKLGQVLELVGRWQDALETYKRGLALAGELAGTEGAAWCRAAIGDVLRKRGQYAEAATELAQAEAAFTGLGHRPGLGQVLHNAGTLAAQQGDYAAARGLYERSLEIRRALNDREKTSSLLNNLGVVARFQGQYPLARSLYEECLAIRQEMHDKWGVAIALNNLGNVALDQGDFAEAQTRLEGAVALQREVGDRWHFANSLNNLGNVRRAQGAQAAAADLYRNSLAIKRDLGDNWGLAYLLEDIGCLAAAGGRAGWALRLTGAAARLREAIGAPLSPVENEKLQALLAPAVAALGEEARAGAWEAGHALTLELAIEEALRALAAPAT